MAKRVVLWISVAFLLMFDFVSGVFHDQIYFASPAGKEYLESATGVVPGYWLLAPLFMVLLVPAWLLVSFVTSQILASKWRNEATQTALGSLPPVPGAHLSPPRAPPAPGAPAGDSALALRERIRLMRATVFFSCLAVLSFFLQALLFSDFAR